MMLDFENKSKTGFIYSKKL